MIGVIGSPEPVQKANFAKNWAEALLECLLEAGELIPYAVVLALFGFAAYLVAGKAYHLMFDPNGVDVATRLDLLSIDPDKLVSPLVIPKPPGMQFLQVYVVFHRYMKSRF